jgi:phenylacetate-CoA ligase
MDALLGAVRRARGTLVVLRTLPRQRQIPFLAPEKVARLRDERVRDLVRYAAASVPYYRALFEREGIDARQIHSAEDLAALPLLDKATVQRDPEQFRADTRLGREALVFRTAGSTGTPVTVYRDRSALLENIAHAERERAVETSLCGRRYAYKRATIAAPEGNFRRVRDFYGRASFRPLRPRHHLISIADPPEAQAEALARIRPRVLCGFGSSLELLYRTAAARRWRLHRPDVIVYAGDAMTPEGRGLIEEEFELPLVSRYSAAEAFRIGFTCERSSSFHLHEDLCLVSVVDDNGVRLTPGERGEIVVSDLVNRGMVLLNYRLGDFGRMGPAGCACGRTSPLLTELEGRVESVLTVGDGSTVHPRLVEKVIHARREVLRFQIVQREPDRFELRLVTTDTESYERIADDLVADLSVLLRDAAVTAERYDELRPASVGKFRAIVGLERSSQLVGA